MGGVIILTRGMVERLTYGIPARYRTYPSNGIVTLVMACTLL